MQRLWLSWPDGSHVESPQAALDGDPLQDRTRPVPSLSCWFWSSEFIWTVHAVLAHLYLILEVVSGIPPPSGVRPPAPGILNMEHHFLGRLLSGLSSSLSSKWLSFLHRKFRLSYSSINSWIVPELEFYPPLSLVLSRHCSATVLLRITWLVVTVFLQSHLHLLSEAPYRHTISADSFLENKRFTWPGKGVLRWRENKARRVECTKDFGQGEGYFIISQ